LKDNNNNNDAMDGWMVGWLDGWKITGCETTLVMMTTSVDVIKKNWEVHSVGGSNTSFEK